jgi:hypothetical protein
MWVPAGMAYIVAALAIVAGWLSPRGSSTRNAPHDKSVISASAN